MHERESWGSNFGFLMAAIGSAVGLGNVWGFPYKMGIGGGFAFLITYLLLVLFCGCVVMFVEMTIGRKTGKSPIRAFLEIGTFKKLGWFGAICGFLILAFYSWIGGCCIKYLFTYISELCGGAGFGGMSGLDYFVQFGSNPASGIFYLGLFMLLTLLVVQGGISKGIEKFNVVGMPALLVLMVILIIKNLSLPGASAGLAFMFTWPTEGFNFFNTLRMAGGQMLFSLSLGMGCMLTYGSYLSKKESIPKNAFIIPFADTLMALLAGLMVIPAVFAFGLDPQGGPLLLFYTMKEVFAAMGSAGAIFGIMFFLLLIVAALTSAMSLLEVVTSCAIDVRAGKGKSANRRPIACCCALAIFILGIPVAIDGAGISGLMPQFTFLADGSESWLDLYDTIAEGLLMPLGSVLMCLVVSRKLGFDWVNEEVTACGQKWLAEGFYRVSIKYITPVLMSFVLVSLFLSYFGI
ncbi:MAG: sodium-dependent transporter [Bacillota bacterium]|nr:sodium-dependent transporter [Bacillota bacterium]